MSTDDLDFDKLRRVAEAATAGPWHWNKSHQVTLDAQNRDVLVELPDLQNYLADARFIATFNPVVVLRLLDLAERGDKK